MKFCKDCKHHRKTEPDDSSRGAGWVRDIKDTPGLWLCRRPHFHLVSGKSWENQSTCSIERGGRPPEGCGEEARYFQPISDPTPTPNPPN